MLQNSALRIGKREEEGKEGKEMQSTTSEEKREKRTEVVRGYVVYPNQYQMMYWAPHYYPQDGLMKGLTDT